MPPRENERHFSDFNDTLPENVFDIVRDIHYAVGRTVDGSQILSNLFSFIGTFVFAFEEIIHFFTQAFFAFLIGVIGTDRSGGTGNGAGRGGEVIKGTYARRDDSADAVSPLNTLNRRVNGVINAINIKIRKETYRRYTPSSIQTPSVNSIAERLKDSNTVKGCNISSPKEARYSPILIAPPTGSTALTKPEKINTTPISKRHNSANIFKTAFLFFTSNFQFSTVSSPYSSLIRPNNA